MWGRDSIPGRRQRRDSKEREEAFTCRPCLGRREDYSACFLRRTYAPGCAGCGFREVLDETARLVRSEFKRKLGPRRERREEEAREQTDSQVVSNEISRSGNDSETMCRRDLQLKRSVSSPHAMARLTEKSIWRRRRGRDGWQVVLREKEKEGSKEEKDGRPEIDFG